MDEKKLLQSSTRIIYSVRNLSSKTYTYWGELAHYFFYKELTLSQIRDIEIEAASKPFKDEQDALSFFNSLSQDEQLWVASALKLLLNNASSSTDLKSQKQLHVFNERILATSSVSQNEVQKKHDELLNSFLEFKKRKRFFVPGSIRLITIDYFLRWAILLISYLFTSKLIYPIIGNYVVSFMMLGLTIYQTKKDELFNEKLTKSYDLKFLFGFKYTYNSAQYSILAFYLFTCSVVSYLLLLNDDNAPEIIFTLSGFVFYYYLLLQVFPIGRLDEIYLEAQITEKNNHDYSDVDENDKRIVLLETQLNSNTARLEAYVLESALFGALAFSAFLQIFATNLISFSDLEKFSTGVFHLLHGIVLAKSDEFTHNFTMLQGKESLFSLISIETLVCSGLFVAVIASRLRFSQVADRMRTDLNLAKAYNEKEERMLESVDQQRNSERFLNINRQIHEHLEQASKKVSEIAPIIRYIVYFRNLGVLCFVSVLITSCLFISTALALLFVVIAVATWVYFNYRLISSSISTLTLQLQIVFARYKYSSLASIIAFILFSFVIRINLGWQETDYLIALSLLSMGAYLSLALLMPFHDNRFGNLDSVIWSNTRVFFAIVIFVSGLGLAMTMLSITVAHNILVFGFCAMFLLSFFVGYYLTMPKWVFFLWAIVLVSPIQGFIFTAMSWTGGNEMSVVGLAGLTLFWLTYFIRRKLFHKLYVRMLLVATILGLMSNYSLIDHRLRTSLMTRCITMYQHQIVDIEPILKYRDEIFQPINWDYLEGSDIKKSVAASDNYIKTYGTRFGITRMHRVMVVTYENFAGDVLRSEQRPDSVSFAKAYLAIHQSEKIAALFKYEVHPEELGLEAEILKKMGRGNEVMDYYKRILNDASSENIKEWARNKIEGEGKIK